MALITEEYRKLNADLHELNNEYGALAARRAPGVANVVRGLQCKTVLDYGCGKGGLKPALQALVPDVDIREYDPAFPDKAAAPAPADFIAFMDVAEHIEPQFIDGVFADLRRLMLKGGIMLISTVPATKLLPDGRNAHLIVQPAEWWLEKIGGLFTVIQILPGPGGITVVVVPK